MSYNLLSPNSPNSLNEPVTVRGWSISEDESDSDVSDSDVERERPHFRHVRTEVTKSDIDRLPPWREPNLHSLGRAAAHLSTGAQVWLSRMGEPDAWCASDGVVPLMRTMAETWIAMEDIGHCGVIAFDGATGRMIEDEIGRCVTAGFDRVLFVGQMRGNATEKGHLVAWMKEAPIAFDPKGLCSHPHMSGFVATMASAIDAWRYGCPAREVEPRTCERMHDRLRQRLMPDRAACERLSVIAPLAQQPIDGETVRSTHVYEAVWRFTKR